MHTQAGVVAGRLAVENLAPVVVDQAGVGQRRRLPMGNAFMVLRQHRLESLQNALHHWRQRFSSKASMFTIVRLGVVTQAGKLPCTQPIDRARETPGMTGTALGLIVPVPLFPQRRKLTEVLNEFLGLILTNELRKVAEPRFQDRAASICRFRHSPLISEFV